MPVLGELPLDPRVREGGDDGKPIVLGDTDTGEAFREFVAQTADMQGLVHRNRVARANR
jgi:ATP-binding protein involved in chromosome partitioning